MRNFLFYLALTTAILQANPETGFEHWLHHYYAQPHAKTLNNRLIEISKALLGKPYIRGALGEGAHALYDQNPRYRIDGFDCETYVTTCIAIATAHNTHKAIQHMQLIRYSAPHQSQYLQRNHFPSLDWIPNAHQLHLLRNITDHLIDADDHPYAANQTILIDKANWLKNAPLHRLFLPYANHTKQRSMLAKLHQASYQYQKKNVSIDFIPLNMFITKNGQLNQQLMQQLPNICIAYFVRSDWQPSEKFGTHMHVSHVGFLVKTHQHWLFREASSRAGQVIETALINRIKQLQHAKHIVGFHIEAPLFNLNH